MQQTTGGNPANVIDSMIAQQVNAMITGGQGYGNNMTDAFPFGEPTTLDISKDYPGLLKDIVKLKALISMMSSAIYSKHAWDGGGNTDVHTATLLYYFEPMVTMPQATGNVTTDGNFSMRFMSEKIETYQSTVVGNQV